MHRTSPIEDANFFAVYRRRSSLLLSILGLLLGLWSSGLLSAQEPTIDREAKIKAAYLFQFIRYVQWPSNAFHDSDSPIVIGTVGEDPINHYLRIIANSRSAGTRKMVYRSVSSGEQARSCHILFFSDNIRSEDIQTIVPNLADVPVLLVGENTEFLTAGGIISFAIVDNNVRLQLSMTAASDHDIKISSQLAKLAQIVD